MSRRGMGRIYRRGDTYWVQILNSPTLWSGSTISLSDSAPASDRFNLSLCEVLPSM